MRFGETDLASYLVSTDDSVYRLAMDESEAGLFARDFSEYLERIFCDDE